jgi:serine acetyltransferase
MRFLDCFTMDLRPDARKRTLRALLLRYFLAVDYRVVVRYRMAMWVRGKIIPAKLGRLIARRMLWRLSLCPGVEINCTEEIGAGFKVAHAHDIVIGAGARIGRNVTLYNGVTLGARRYADAEEDLGDHSRYPILEDGVTIFSGAKVLGSVTVGRGSIVGANSVVLESFPENSVIAGVPARLIRSLEPCPAEMTH